MLTYTAISLLIIIGLILINILLIKSKPDIEKLSPYECGMNPLGDARHKFRIDYILIAILFIVFDLEVIFLFPYLIKYPNSILAYWGISLFLIILTLGFIFEYTKGALNLHD